MKTPSPSRQSVAEISRGALLHNLKIFQKAMGPGVAMTAVVKADAYGHDAVEVSRLLRLAGVRSFGVATLEEGLQLRQSGIKDEIIVLGAVDPRYLLEAARKSVGVTLWTSGYIKDAVRASGKSPQKLNVHLKIDTGMNRLGFGADEADAALFNTVEMVRQGKLRLASVYTHFASGDGSTVGIGKQLKKFLSCQLPGDVPWHCANSSAALRVPECRLDRVRPGIFLYGALDPTVHPLAKKQKPVMALKSRVLRLHDVKRGEGVSYGPAWTASKKTRIATLGLGYADGVPRNLSNRGQVLVGGKRCRIVGRVCMDLLMVDVSAVRSAKAGDEAVLIGQQGREVVTVHEWASLAKTISYEITSGISGRVPRKWVP